MQIMTLLCVPFCKAAHCIAPQLSVRLSVCLMPAPVSKGVERLTSGVVSHFMYSDVVFKVRPWPRGHIFMTLALASKVMVFALAWRAALTVF